MEALSMKGSSCTEIEVQILIKMTHENRGLSASVKNIYIQGGFHEKPTSSEVSTCLPRSRRKNASPAAHAWMSAQKARSKWRTWLSLTSPSASTVVRAWTNALTTRSRSTRRSDIAFPRGFSRINSFSLRSSGRRSRPHPDKLEISSLRLFPRANRCICS